jgi:hypothetical protein
LDGIAKFLDLTSEKSDAPCYGTDILGYFAWKLSTKKGSATMGAGCF